MEPKKPFNPDWGQRLISFDDMHPKKKVRIPVAIQLLNLMNEKMDAITSIGGQRFAYVPTGKHNFFNVPLDGSYIRSWMVEQQAAINAPPPSSAAMREAIKAFAARSTAGSISAARRQINLRVGFNPAYTEPVPIRDKDDVLTGYKFFEGQCEPAILYSLDTRTGRHVAITDRGWSIQPTNTEFLLDPVQKPLPDPIQQPKPDTALDKFRKLLRLDAAEHDDAWKSLLDWTLTAMRPPRNAAFHEYPILNLIGPENSGKTTTAKLLTQLIDPSGTPIHTLPTTERRLHILAAAHHVLAFDDPGKINPQKSRNLSRLSTGIASEYRHFAGMLVRPIILTTTETKDTRHLANRIVDVELPEVENPLTPHEVWQAFQKLQPEIIGALYTLISRTLEAPQPRLPNRRTIYQKIDESIPLLLEKQGGTWKGTVTDLQIALAIPITPKALGTYLKQNGNLPDSPQRTTTPSR